jgi:hypothetical protein
MEVVVHEVKEGDLVVAAEEAALHVSLGSGLGLL